MSGLAGAIPAERNARNIPVARSVSLEGPASHSRTLRPPPRAVHRTMNRGRPRPKGRGCGRRIARRGSGQSDKTPTSPCPSPPPGGGEGTQTPPPVTLFQTPKVQQRTQPPLPLLPTGEERAGVRWGFVPAIAAALWLAYGAPQQIAESTRSSAG